MAITDIFLPEGDAENPLLKEQGYSQLNPSTGSAFDAGLQLGSLDAPVNFLTDLNKYNKPGAKLTPEEANSQYGIPNFLNFDREITPEAAEVVRDRTMKRLQFEDRLSRASTGQVAVSYLGQFTEQMFDPINLAASFIPVTKIPGASKLITSLATSNPFVRRAGVGAIEGTVGQLAIEPIYLAGDYYGMEDHDTADVMRNLAFGAVFGAGAHVTFGGVFDGAKFLYGKTKNTHQRAATTAINQMLEGKVVEVDPILRTDENFIRNEILRDEIESIQSTGNYSGPEAYNYIESYPLGTQEGRLLNPGNPVIAPALPTRASTMDIIDLDGDISPANLGGSNEAIIVNHEYGPMYVKPISESQARSEVLANNLYRILGDEFVLSADLVRVNGKLGVGTTLYENAEQVSGFDLVKTFYDNATPDSEKAQIRAIVANQLFDMFLGNRDAFALGNIIKVDGEYKKIDQGGALLYRARGARKADFTADLEELQTMVDDTINPEAATAFWQIASPNDLNKAAEKILSTDFGKIVDQVLAANLPVEEEAELLGVLAGRLTTLRNKFPEAAAKVHKNTGKLIFGKSQSAFETLKNAAIKFYELLHKKHFDILDAVSIYQTTSFGPINNYLRTDKFVGDDVQLSALKKEIELLDKASELGKLEAPAILHRWMPSNMFNQQFEPAFMSTSLFESRSPFHVDENIYNNLHVVVHAPEGTPGFWPDASNVYRTSMESSYSAPEAGEYEFTIGRGQQYEVISVPVDRTSLKGHAYKEVHIRLLGEKPAPEVRPLNLEEIKAGATKYFNQPSSAADPEILLPVEAVTFNSLVEDLGNVGDLEPNAELVKSIADLEASVKMILSESELKAINESTSKLAKDVDNWVKGLEQAFTCWKGA
ncbi:MAG TPA: ADP-ribosyltransferase [Vitreimonas sp.]|nr:ADP-ribosyltransferase [Vitreimonas sp.]